MDIKLRQELAVRLDKIEESVKAKGHPMQDFSTIKIALVDLIEVVRKIIKNKGSREGDRAEI